MFKPLLSNTAWDWVTYLVQNMQLGPPSCIFLTQHLLNTAASWRNLLHVEYSRWCLSCSMVVTVQHSTSHLRWSWDHNLPEWRLLHCFVSVIEDSCWIKKETSKNNIDGLRFPLPLPTWCASTCHQVPRAGWLLQSRQRLWLMQIQCKDIPRTMNCICFEAKVFHSRFSTPGNAVIDTNLGPHIMTLAWAYRQSIYTPHLNFESSGCCGIILTLMEQYLTWFHKFE